MTQDEMIAKFRRHVELVQADFERLEAAVGPDLKRWLSGPKHLLSDINLLILDPRILAEPRTDERLAYWLQSGERILRGAEEQIAEVATIAREFGPNARMMG